MEENTTVQDKRRNFVAFDEFETHNGLRLSRERERETERDRERKRESERETERDRERKRE